MIHTDLKAYIRPLIVANIAKNAVNNTAINGESIAVNGYGSIVIAAAYTVGLTDAATLTLKIKVETSSDGSTWETYREEVSTVITKTAATQKGVVKRGYEVEGAKEYVRVVITPVKSTAGDIVDIAPIVILGGGQQLPIDEQQTSPII